MEEGIETMRGFEKFQVLICGGRKETKNFTENDMVSCHKFSSK